jgi:hypothetical protein
MDKPEIPWEEESDAGFTDAPAEDEEERRRREEGRKQRFNTMLRPGLEERLNAAAFWADKSKAQIVDEALRLWLDRAEAERDEPFEVLPPHRIQREAS